MEELVTVNVVQMDEIFTPGGFIKAKKSDVLFGN